MTLVPEPSAALIDWIAELTGARPTFGEPFDGASTATVWPVRAGDRELVVKFYDAGLDGVGAADVARDAAGLRAAEEVGIVAPRFVSADPGGERVGHPAIVMTRLTGAPRAHGRPDPPAWADGLADVLIAVARAPLPNEPLSERSAWYDLPVDAPTWARDPGPWQAMTDVLRSPRPPTAKRFIHRDLHKLNTLWDGDRAVGLVDWVNGCLGPIESDIACSRMNIVLAEDDHDGFALADRFLRRCLDAGLPWHPSWDVEWLASIGTVETLAAGAAYGARVTVGGLQRRVTEAIPRALAAVERWNG